MWDDLGYLKYVWIAYFMSLVPVFFGLLCGLSLAIAGFLIFMHLLLIYHYIFPRMASSMDYYTNYFPSLAILITTGYLLYQLSLLYGFCECWE